MLFSVESSLEVMQISLCKWDDFPEQICKGQSLGIFNKMDDISKKGLDILSYNYFPVPL
jgi:hypothetical protein